jgi:hydrogenase maturation protease
MVGSRILIAGIGNIFFGDDAFGVEVAWRLATRSLPDGVQVVEFGIRGLDLTYALLEPHEAVIIVDAVPRGGKPGTLYVIEPELQQLEDADSPAPMMETHNLDPLKVLALARSMGGMLDRVLLVGCEPETLGDKQDFQFGLSDSVRSAADEAVQLIESLVGKLLGAAEPMTMTGPSVSNLLV